MQSKQIQIGDRKANVLYSHKAWFLFEREMGTGKTYGEYLQSWFPGPDGDPTPIPAVGFATLLWAGLRASSKKVMDGIGPEDVAGWYTEKDIPGIVKAVIEAINEHGREPEGNGSPPEKAPASP